MNIIERLRAMFRRAPQHHELDDEIQQFTATSNGAVERADQAIDASQRRRRDHDTAAAIRRTQRRLSGHSR